jgi:hypothetical protein
VSTVLSRGRSQKRHPLAQIRVIGQGEAGATERAGTSFLTHFGPETPYLEAPRRVYARVDQSEPTGPQGEERVFLLDSIDADWFDEEGVVARGSFAAPENAESVDRRVSVVEIRTEGDYWSGLLDEGLRPWLEITFDDAGRGALHWAASDPDAHPACGGSQCDLICHQR